MGSCGAGLVELRRTNGVLAFAAPPTLRSGPLDDEYLQRIASAFGIARDRIVDHQWVDNGPGWAVVLLATADEVLALEPDLAQIPDAKIGAVGAYPEGGSYAFEIRAFAPGVGVPEDPVTGSLNASVAQWLTGTGRAQAPYRVSQGARLGRAGEIRIDRDPDDTVWVGGATTTFFSGTAVL